MFGTFEPEKEPVSYGLVKNVNTFNPVTITFMGWKAIIDDIKQAKVFHRLCIYFLARPTLEARRCFEDFKRRGSI